MEILAYVLSFSGMVSSITASLIKGKKMGLVLFFVLLGNFLVATSYVVSVINGNAGAVSGAISCYIGALQAGINGVLAIKNKEIPKWLIGVYAIMFIAANLMGGFSYLTILAIIACLTFIMSLIQKNGAGYRVWAIANLSLWVLFDLLSKSEALVTHIVLFAFTVTGMIIHDRKQK